MPVNAPAEYFKAEAKFQSAKTKDEKIVALEEMIRLLPKHHGSETMHAQLKSRLAKLKKEGAKKAGGRIALSKEGEAQVCLVGYTNSGKSFILSRLTQAKPAIASHPYTTTKPEIGMMDYSGLKIQIVEIPSTFDPQYMSIARTADLIALVARHEKEEIEMKKVLANSFIRTKTVIVNPFSEPMDHIKQKIWHALGLIVTYTKKKHGSMLEPMALPAGASVKEFAQHIHKDFVRNFRFARIYRNGRQIQAGLDYKLKDGDIVEIYAK